MRPGLRIGKPQNRRHHSLGKEETEEEIFKTVVALIILAVIFAACHGSFGTRSFLIVIVLAALKPLLTIRSAIFRSTRKVDTKIISNFLSLLDEKPQYSVPNRSTLNCTKPGRRQSFSQEEWLTASYESLVSSTYSGSPTPEETLSGCFTVQIATTFDNVTANQKAKLNMKRAASRLIAREDQCDEAGMFAPLYRTPDNSALVESRKHTMKTGIDRVVAACVLVTVAPLLLAIFALLLCQTVGSGTATLKRKSWHNKSVSTISFRTAESGQIPGCRTRLSRKLVQIGFADFIHRSGLSGLPQLINVLRGDLSLVGPNPSSTMSSQLDNAGESVVSEMATRQRVRPGLIDFALSQNALGSRNSIVTAGRRNRLNVLYLTAMTPWLDAKSIARTLALLVREPAA